MRNATFWVGSGAFLMFFLQPAVAELGPQGGAVMGHITQERKLPVVTGISAVLTVLAGLALAGLGWLRPGLDHL